MEPERTAESTRMPGPVGGSKLTMVPGHGAKPLRISSALMRNSKAWPFDAGSSVKDSGSPAAMRICSAITSTPVTASEIGRASCRERVEVAGGDGPVREQTEEGRDGSGVRRGEKKGRDAQRG